MNPMMMITPQAALFFKAAHAMVMKFGGLDLLFIFVVFIGLIHGYRKGFGMMLGRIVQLVFSMTVTLEYSNAVAGLFSFDSQIITLVIRGVVFLVLAVVSGFIAKLVLGLIGKALKINFGEFIERIGGMLGGCAYLILLMSFISYFILLFPVQYVHDLFENRSMIGLTLSRVPTQVHRTGSRMIPVGWRAQLPELQP